MHSGWIAKVAMGSLLAAALCAQGQQGAEAAVGRPAPSAHMVSSGQAAAQDGSLGVAGEVIGEIDDPGNGNRWLLSRNPGNPGGPGRLELEQSAAGAASRRPSSPGGGSPSIAGNKQAQTVIRSGEPILVEQHTARVDARLEAVALGPARAGAAFTARLRMGGGLVRAVAVAPGQALLAEERRP